MRHALAAVVLACTACRPSSQDVVFAAEPIAPASAAASSSDATTAETPSGSTCGYGETKSVTFTDAELRFEIAEFSVAVLAMDNWSCSETIDGGDVCMDVHAEVGGATVVVNVCIVSPEPEHCETFMRIVGPTERGPGLDVRWAADTPDGKRLEFAVVGSSR